MNVRRGWDSFESAKVDVENECKDRKPAYGLWSEKNIETEGRKMKEQKGASRLRGLAQ